VLFVVWSCIVSCFSTLIPIVFFFLTAISVGNHLVVIQVFKNKYVCEFSNDCIEYFFIQYFYRQSTTFVHNLFLKTCSKVEMYESRAVDLRVIRGVLFPLLKVHKKSLFMGNKQNGCTSNYNTFLHEFNRR
jgi:hypothetical protein